MWGRCEAWDRGGAGECKGMVALGGWMNKKGKASRQEVSRRGEYNHRRPHSSLGYTPPAAFASRCEAKAGTSVVDALRCAAGIADGVIVLKGRDPITRLS